MSLYIDARAVRDLAEISTELIDAQDELNRHALDLTGRCTTCRSHGCGNREAALRKFSRYMRLPARVPMSSGPERIFVKRVTLDEHRR